MSWFSELFEVAPCPSDNRAEVNRLIQNLVRIGTNEDFLSERPGGGFNSQCRNIQARDIGKRLAEIGGVPLMDYVFRKVRRKVGKQIGGHLEYAWAEVGGWMP